MPVIFGSVSRMRSPNRRQYLLLDKRCRRYSAPDDLRSGFSKSYTSEESEDDSKISKVSVIDLSVLFEGQSGSDSSLELDTSLSRATSPFPPYESQTLLPEGCYDCRISNENRDPFFSSLWTWAAFRSLLVSQVMSLCVSLLDLTIQEMNGEDNPLSVSTQNLPLYVYLGLFWTPQLALRDGGRGMGQVLRLSGLRYILLALLHVQATTLAVTALRHQTFVGNQMIDCVAASLSFLLAFVCLEVEFQVTHVYGFGIAFLGAIAMCTAVTRFNDDVDGDMAMGDMVRFGSGLFLCFTTLAEELIVKSIDSVEYLGMIGLFGSVICGCQGIMMDINSSLPAKAKYWLYWILYSFVQFSITCLAPKVLRDVGATGMHLSLISSTFYTNIFRTSIYHTSFQQLLLFSFIFIMLGNYIFAVKRAYTKKQYFYPVQVTISRPNN